MRRSLLAVLLCSAPAFASASMDEGAFQQCVADLRKQATELGIAEEAIAAGLSELRLQPRVLELDRRQPEFFQTFWQYLDARVTAQRVAQGRALLEQHADSLQRAYERFGVRPHYLVALWGLETNYGSYVGSMPVLDALATLACDPRRSAFFTSELMQALRILETGHMRRADMRGSWAGAMGHMQFMPSTFNRYAIDGSGNGRIDLWHDLDDVFASAAHYLASIGWRPGERWGREVRLPEDFDWSLAGLERREPVNTWAQRGVRAADGGPLPASQMKAALVLPAGHRGPAFLVYENFHRILQWNPSVSYALAVGHLADRIAGMGTLHARAPEGERALHREEVEELQRRLNALGFDAGEADGIVGRMTRAALREYQLSRGLPADGYPDVRMLEALRRY